MRETMKNETGEYDEQTGYVSDVIIQQKQGRRKQIRKTDMPNLDYTFRKRNSAADQETEHGLLSPQRKNPDIIANMGWDDPDS